MDKREKTVKAYQEKSNSNFKLYELLKKEEKFNDWQIVALFYSALCLVKAYLYSKTGLPLSSINSHSGIKNFIGKEPSLKRNNVIVPYEELYREARTARYEDRNFSDARIKKALENLKKIKQLVVFN